MTTFRLSLAIATIGVLAASAHAQTELKIDGFVTNQAAGFQGGFVTGEEGAVRLDPSGAGTAPYQVTKVRLLFGGAATTQTITLHIYADSAGVVPGAELLQADFQLTGANDAFQELDISAMNVSVSGPFRVSIEFQHDGLPSIARDDDGNIDTSENFLKESTLGWANSNLFGLTGDWIIRADVVPASGGGGQPDAGMGSPGDPDAGGGSGGGPDAGTGQACALNSDCPNGQYCGSGDSCTFDCRLDIDCESGNECNEIGQCVEKGGGGGCATGGGASGGFVALILLCLVALAPRRRG